MRDKWKIRKIVKIIPRDNFILLCSFSDGTVVEYDMGKTVKEKGPMVRPLRQKFFFNKVFLEFGAPTWPNGFDVCADLIFMKGKKIQENTASRKLSKRRGRSAA